MASRGRIYPVILAGGKGERLWPLSNTKKPKHLQKIFSDKTMFQETIERFSDSNIYYSPQIITNELHCHEIQEQLSELKVTEFSIISEPKPKNTAPAIIISSLLINEHDPNAIILACPSDHLISSKAEFNSSVLKAMELAEKDYIVTFGIKPTAPKTGYGYIKSGKSLENKHGYEIHQFTEKPEKEVAERFLKDGNYFWNSGIFCFKAKTLIAEVKKICPGLLGACKLSIGTNNTENIHLLLEKEFSKIRSISFDYAIMEKTTKGAIVPIDIAWNDLGNWEEIWNTHKKDSSNNVKIGNVYSLDAKNSYIRSNGPTIAAIGTKNLVIVASDNKILVTTKDNSQKAKELAQKIEYNDNLVKKSWGQYEILSRGEGYLIKKIFIKPGEKILLKNHIHTTKHCIIIEGNAKITLGDTIKIITKNEFVFVDNGQILCIENPYKDPLIILKTLSGEHIGDDDIIRFNEKYNVE